MTCESETEQTQGAQITFLDATEEVCEECPWLIPVYYLRVVLAANELCRADEIPPFLKITATLADDDNKRKAECFIEELASLYEVLVGALDLSTVDNLLLFSSNCEADQLRCESPEKYKILRAVSDLPDIRDGFYFYNEAEQLEYWRERVVPNPFTIVSSPYIEEIKAIESRRKKLQKRMGEADPTERDRMETCESALREYITFLDCVRPPLLHYKATRRDFARLCSWKRFPLPEDYQEILSQGTVNNVLWRIPAEGDLWELPTAISTVFGEIGDYSEIEVDFFDRLICNFDRTADVQENVAESFGGVEKTLEYMKAQKAVLGGLVEGFFDKECATYQVRPKSFLRWVRSLGVTVPATLRHLCDTSTDIMNKPQTEITVVSEKNTRPGEFVKPVSEEELSDEDPSLYVELQFWSDEHDSLCLRTKHKRLGKSKDVTFLSGEKGEKLMRLLIASGQKPGGPGNGVSMGELLIEVYNWDSRKEVRAYNASLETASVSNTGIMDRNQAEDHNSIQRALFEYVLRPKYKDLQSLVSSTRTKLGKAGINPNILPKISTAFDDKDQCLALSVASFRDLDQQRVGTSREVSLDRFQSIASTKGLSRDDDAEEDPNGTEY